MLSMQDETSQILQDKAPKVMGSYRLPLDLVEQIKLKAGQLNVSEAWVVEMYLGVSLGIRQFPNFEPPVLQQRA